MLNQLIQTLVVECSHQVGIHRLAVGILYGKRPLLLLSGSQAVAECCPLQLKFLVRHWALNLGYVRVALAVLHPSIGYKQSVLVLILICKLAVYQLVAAVHSPLLYQLLAREDAIDYMHILIR